MVRNKFLYGWIIRIMTRETLQDVFPLRFGCPEESTGTVVVFHSYCVFKTGYTGVFFNKGARKKVPVKLAGVVETSPEYYLQRVEFTPDSVEVLAPSAILDTITEAFITPVYFSDLSANEKTISMLRPVRGAKFIPDQVEMNVMIDLYTEKTVEVPVFGVNFPGSKDLRTFPSKVKVTFRVGMSRFKEITADDFVLAVTYEELMKNRSPKIQLHLKSMPSGVSNVRIDPSEVDYLIEQVQEENE